MAAAEIKHSSHLPTPSVGVPLASPDLNTGKSTATAQNALSKARRHSNPEEKSLKTSVGQIAPIITPSEEQKEISRLDFVFGKTQKFISDLTERLAQTADPAHNTSSDVLIQHSERSFLKLAQQLDDLESLFSNEQKTKLFKSLDEGFKFLRAAFVNKYPMIDPKKISEITLKRTEAIRLRLEALAQTHPSEAPPPPFPTSILMPDPGLRNELFPHATPSGSVNDFYLQVSNTLFKINKEMGRYAAKLKSDVGSLRDYEISEYEEQLVAFAHLTFEPHSVLSADQKIKLLNQLLEVFSFFYGAVIRKKPQIKEQLDSLNTKRVKAIQSKIDALEKSDNPALLNPFPTETLLPVVPESSLSLTIYLFRIIIIGLIASLTFVVYRHIYRKIPA